MPRIFLSLLFAAVFGLMFIFYGGRRIVFMRREPRPAEAAFWGGFGVLLGVAVIAGLWWFTFGPDDRQKPNPGVAIPAPDIRDFRPAAAHDK